MVSKCSDSSVTQVKEKTPKSLVKDARERSAAYFARKRQEQSNGSAASASMVTDLDVGKNLALSAFEGDGVQVRYVTLARNVYPMVLGFAGPLVPIMFVPCSYPRMFFRSVAQFDYQ